MDTYRPRATMTASHHWEVFTQSERLAIVPSAADRGKICFQITPAPGSLWMWSGSAWLPSTAPAVVNDLTTGGIAAALSAEQGKALQLAKAELPATIAVASSRDLTAADNGKTLECTATVTLTIPAGLPGGFHCEVIPFGTTSFASSGGALLNGGTATLTREASTNTLVTLVSRTAPNSFVLDGAAFAIVGASTISTMLAALKAVDTSRTSIGWHGMSIIAGVGADGTTSTVRNARWQDASLPAKVSQALNTARGGAFGPGVETLSSPNSLNTWFALAGGATLTNEYTLVAGVAGQGVSLVGGSSSTIAFTISAGVAGQVIRVYGICTQASSGVLPRYSLSGANTASGVAMAASTSSRPVPGASAWFYTTDIVLTNAGSTVVTLHAAAVAAPTAGGGNIVYYAVDPNALATPGLTIHRLAQSTRAMGMTIAGAIDSTDTTYPHANWAGSAQANWRNGQTDSITTALGLQGVICSFDINEVNTVSGGGVHGFGWTIADHRRHIDNYLAAMNARGLKVLFVLGPLRNPSTVVQTTYNQLDVINAYKAAADASPNGAYLDLTRNFAPGGTAQQKFDAQVADASGWLAAEAPNYVHPGPGAIAAFANDVAMAVQAAW